MPMSLAILIPMSGANLIPMSLAPEAQCTLARHLAGYGKLDDALF